jgi:carboxypeptidase C (cathepsin A)
MFAKSFVAAAILAVANAADENDRVTSLPGQATFDTYPVYSGYLQIPDMTNKLHYMFVESQNAPTTDPLVIWFNGGPGCSSMLGWAQEHGPYVMKNGTSVFVENEYSWNMKANMLYIESPAGVGFSYCGNTADCTFNDETSATQNLSAVLAWFTKFPEFGTNDLYLSGESYAGIYVPYLAREIYNYNQANLSDSSVFKPNLIGFAVGNGVTNWTYDTTPSYVEMGYWHSLYSDTLRKRFQAANCDFGGLGMPNATTACEALYAQFYALTRNVDIYNIYGICWGTSLDPALEGQENRPRKGWTARDYTPWAFPKQSIMDQVEGDSSSSLPPCTFGTPLMDYFD